MNALLKPAPLSPYSTGPEKPDTINQRVVEAELQRLVDAEVFNEAGQDREFLAIALHIMGRWWSVPYRWTEALVDVQYSAAWSDAGFIALLRDGDECAMGRLIRERWLIEFAADVFEAAEREWNV